MASSTLGNRHDLAVVEITGDGGRDAFDARNYMNRVFNKALKVARTEDFTGTASGTPSPAGW